MPSELGQVDDVRSHGVCHVVMVRDEDALIRTTSIVHLSSPPTENKGLTGHEVAVIPQITTREPRERREEMSALFPPR